MKEKLSNMWQKTVQDPNEVHNLTTMDRLYADFQKRPILRHVCHCLFIGQSNTLIRLGLNPYCGWWWCSGPPFWPQFGPPSSRWTVWNLAVVRHCQLEIWIFRVTWRGLLSVGSPKNSGFSRAIYRFSSYVNFLRVFSTRRWHQQSWRQDYVIWAGWRRKWPVNDR